MKFNKSWQEEIRSTYLFGIGALFKSIYYLPMEMLFFSGLRMLNIWTLAGILTFVIGKLIGISVK